MKFHTQRSINFRYTIEIVSDMYAKEIGKLGFLLWGLPSTVFRKGVHWTDHLEEIYLSIQSDLKYSKFLKLRFL